MGLLGAPTLWVPRKSGLFPSGNYVVTVGSMTTEGFTFYGFAREPFVPSQMGAISPDDPRIHNVIWDRPTTVISCLASANFSVTIDGNVFNAFDNEDGNFAVSETWPGSILPASGTKTIRIDWL
ncbi:MULTISPECIES: hypothetical protein [unclassified Chelatococcus]|uniref:hypothetical protein n=1 Tax=unclassified Chelatococcus TaxID=2638111 RepID=UPI001BCB986A|nr:MULTISPECIES: hypothetical protein [unclassified Chelatococcus]MBS7699153.1 hypothetical protein [Chelatococcus sp. YT9]MBX3554934.1 hypothetical protein [Chelatococcus sp.]